MSGGSMPFNDLPYTGPRAAGPSLQPGGQPHHNMNNPFINFGQQRPSNHIQSDNKHQRPLDQHLASLKIHEDQQPQRQPRESRPRLEGFRVSAVLDKSKKTKTSSGSWDWNASTTTEIAADHDVLQSIVESCKARGNVLDQQDSLKRKIQRDKVDHVVAERRKNESNKNLIWTLAAVQPMHSKSKSAQRRKEKEVMEIRVILKGTVKDIAAPIAPQGQPQRAPPPKAVPETDFFDFASKPRAQTFDVHDNRGPFHQGPPRPPVQNRANDHFTFNAPSGGTMNVGNHPPSPPQHPTSAPPSAGNMNSNITGGPFRTFPVNTGIQHPVRPPPNMAPPPRPTQENLSPMNFQSRPQMPRPQPQPQPINMNMNIPQPRPQQSPIMVNSPAPRAPQQFERAPSPVQVFPPSRPRNFHRSTGSESTRRHARARSSSTASLRTVDDEVFSAQSDEDDEGYGYASPVSSPRGSVASSRMSRHSRKPSSRSKASVKTSREPAPAREFSPVLRSSRSGRDRDRDVDNRDRLNEYSSESETDLSDGRGGRESERKRRAIRRRDGDRESVRRHEERERRAYQDSRRRERERERRWN